MESDEFDVDTDLFGYSASMYTTCFWYTLAASFLLPFFYFYYYLIAKCWFCSKESEKIHGTRHDPIKPSVDDKRNDNIRTTFVLNNSVVGRKLEFLKRVGPTYGYGCCPPGSIDLWRSREFPKLISPVFVNEHRATSKHVKNNDKCTPKNEEKEVYLDYAGAALVSQSQLQNIFSSMTSGPMSLLGNPHSSNSGPASSRASLLVEQAKKLILDHFNCHPDLDYCLGDNGINDHCHPGYDVIFTSGATEALRILATSFPWKGCTNTKIEQTDSSIDQGFSNSRSSSIYIYPHNSHTSLVGMRGPAMAAGATFRCIHLDKICAADCSQFLRWATINAFSSAAESATLEIQNKNSLFFQKNEEASLQDQHNQNHSSTEVLQNAFSDSGTNQWNHTDEISHLLALPLECNFGGDVIPANSIFRTVRRCNRLLSTSSCTRARWTARYHRWYTLLDIASAAAHSAIDLKEVDPDFACISFYKMFGFPTGLGALLVKRSTGVPLLNHRRRIPPSCTHPTKSEKERDQSHHDQCVDYHYSMDSTHVYYGGGSVNAILPSCNFIIPKPQLSSIVNGTVHFQGIASLVYGFRELSRVGGMAAVSTHSRLLALELVRRFQHIRHENGNPAIRIYGAWNNISVMQVEREISNDNLPGPTVAFNVIRSDSSYVGYNEVSKLASLNNPPIQLRTGCFCNVGACQEALSISDNDFKENYFVMGHVCGDHNDIISGKPTGAIRASFGKDNCWDDVDALAIFLQRMVVNQKDYSYGSNISSSELHSLSKCLPSYRARPWKIRELYVFPIKSCAPMRVKSWRLDVTTGQLEFDREFALIDTNGVVMRLQSFPQMAKIRPSIDLQRKTLTVTAPGVEDLVLFLDDHACFELSHDVNVCGNNHNGKVFGSRISAAWFSSVLGIRCFLVRYMNNAITERNGDEKCAVESKTSQAKSVNITCRSFSNEAPLLLITQQAVNILNNTLKVQGQSLVSSLHFRPNLVLDTDDECNERISQYINDGSQSSIKQHPENWWHRILINEGKLEFSVVGQCSRCTMVDICPETGKKEYKALRAMAEYCRSKGNINFGVFLRLNNGECLAIRKHFSVISEDDKVTPCMAR